LAVLVTLIYLAVQVKQARAESRSTLLQHRSDAARQLWAIESTSPELQAALTAADQQLGRDERSMKARLKELTSLDDTQTSMVIAHFSAHFFHRQTLFLSDLDKAEREVLDHQLRHMFGGGAFRLCFDSLYQSHMTGGGGFDLGFVRHVYQVLNDAHRT
jgi:hypothetical protein